MTQCERNEKPRGVSHAPRGSYLLVEVSQSQILRNASAASKRKIGVPSLTLGHSARLAKSSPPLSHRGDKQRGQLVAARTRCVFAADSGGPKPERVVSRSVDRLAVEDLEMFWHAAICEAIDHIAHSSQSSCRNDSLPNRNAA